jgi:tetratricopeptide (TPR) repeat protein
VNRKHKRSLRLLGQACCIALLLCSIRVGHAQEADPDEHYRHGVELAKTGKLNEAREEFKAAFALRPHARVSYNLAKLSLELGEKPQAISYLRTYLMFEQSQLPPEQVAEVKSILAELEGEVRAEQPAATDSPGVTGQDGTETSAPERATSAAPPPGQKSAAAEPVVALRRLEPRSVQVSQLPELALTSAGVAVLLGGVGLWFWNDNEYEQALQEHAELERNEPPSAITAVDYDRSMEHTYAVGRNAERFDSVQRLDILAWTAIGVGAVTTATGAWLLFNPAESRLVVGSRSVGIRW